MSLPSLEELAERSLVPPSSGSFVKIMSAAQIRDGDARARLIEILRTLWNPWTCPASELPLLAYAWSVDIWNESWPETRKRSVIAESRAYHARKTTVSGYRMALGYRDAQLVRANLPRHSFFAGRAPTPESHEKWLSSLPEIRIYQATMRVRAGRKGFFVGRRFARSIERVMWDTRRAELIRNGSTTQLVISGLARSAEGAILSEPERLLIPGPPVRKFRAGGFVGWPVASGGIAGSRVVSLSYVTEPGEFSRNAISPSLTPLDVTPKYFGQSRPIGRGIFANRPRWRRGARFNDAEFHLYASFRLADGTEAEIETARLRNRIGRTRLRRVSFTAGLMVHAPRDPLPSIYPRGRIARIGPDKLIAELESAIVSASAARDTLFMDINSTRAMTYADLAHLPDHARYGLSILN